MKVRSYPTASSLFNCSFRALRTSVELASLVTLGSYALNLLFGAPHTEFTNQIEV